MALPIPPLRTDFSGTPDKATAQAADIAIWDVINSLTQGGTTTGSGTAYVLALPRTLQQSYEIGMRFKVKFHAASGAAPTLNINGFGPLQLVRVLNDGTIQNLAAPSGLTPVIPAGRVHEVVIISGTQAEVLELPRRVFVGALTRNMATASGSVATTGLGFSPRRIRFMAKIPTTATGSDGTWGGNGDVCVYQTPGSTSDNTSGSASIYAQPAPGDAQGAAVSAIGPDGFTLNWTKFGTPTGTLNVVFQAEE